MIEEEKLADYWIIGGELNRTKKFYNKFFVRPELEKIPGKNSHLDEMIEVTRQEMFTLLDQGKRVCIGAYNKKNNNYEYNGIVCKDRNRHTRKRYFSLLPVQQRYDLLGPLPATVLDDWDERKEESVEEGVKGE